MKNFIKENWFKLIVSLFLIILLALAVFFYEEYSKDKKATTPKDVTEENSQTSGQELSEKKIDVRSDEYVVTYDKDGNPVNWVVIDRASIILGDTLTTYKNSLVEIKNIQAKEQENLNSAYGVLAKISSPTSKTQVQTLINYEESYIASGEKLIGLLEDLVTNYEDLQNVTTKRDPQLYLYYSDEINKLESQKGSIVNDYANKQTAKQNYAKSMLVQ